MGLVWESSPELLAQAVDRYGVQVFAVVRQIANQLAELLQASAQEFAPWSDRTGNARQQLFAFAEQVSEDLVMIYLSHGPNIYYGVFLETINFRYKGHLNIIEPTLEAYKPVLDQMLRAAFG